MNQNILSKFYNFSIFFFILVLCFQNPFFDRFKIGFYSIKFWEFFFLLNKILLLFLLKRICSKMLKKKV
jgi:hypothetical protein